MTRALRSLDVVAVALTLGACSPDDAPVPPAPYAERATFEPLVTRPAPSAMALTCDVDVTNSAREHHRTRYAVDGHGLPLWSSTVYDDGRTSTQRWTWRWASSGVLARGYDGSRVTEYTNGRRTFAGDARHSYRSWSWDDAGRPTGEGWYYEGDPSSSGRGWTWDDEGRLIGESAGNDYSGSRTEYHWADDGRYLGFDSKQWDDGSTERTLTWTDHDEAGRPLHAEVQTQYDLVEPSTSAGTVDWTWDDAGRPLEYVADTTEDDGDERVVRSVWDYSPTADGGTRIDEVTTDLWTTQQSWTLDASGRIIEAGSGAETWTWDSDGRLRAATTAYGETYAWSAGCPDGLWWVAPADWRPTVLPDLSDLPDPTDSLENGR